ncbi:MAG: hypothetical protein ACLPVY_10965 [Acidimicrobiia bacterium]
MFVAVLIVGRAAIQHRVGEDLEGATDLVEFGRIELQHVVFGLFVLVGRSASAWGADESAGG